VGEDGFDEIGGWVNTTGPMWLHAALLRRCADSLDEASRTPDEDGDE
jgi:hypothetical protein